MERIGLLSSCSHVLRVHSKRQIKRLFRRSVERTSKPQVSASDIPPLTYAPTYVPETVSYNGWSAAPESGPIPGLPFVVKRTAKGLQMPVYRDYRNGGTRVLTILRRYHGNEAELQSEMSKVCQGAPVVSRPGRLEVTGDHAQAVKSWLVGLGF